MLRDSRRVHHLAAAIDGRQRLSSSYDYFRKVLKQGVRLSQDAGDRSTLRMLDRSCDRLADQILAAVGQLEAELESRGYYREQ